MSLIKVISERVRLLRKVRKRATKGGLRNKFGSGACSRQVSGRVSPVLGDRLVKYVRQKTPVVWGGVEGSQAGARRGVLARRGGRIFFRLEKKRNANRGAYRGSSGRKRLLNSRALCQ